MTHPKTTLTLLFTVACLLTTQTTATQTSSLNASTTSSSINHKLPEFYAKYGIEFYGVTAAEAHYKLTYTNTGYKFTQQTKLKGMASLFASDTVSVTSIIDKVNNKLLLKKHTYIQTGKEKNRNEDISIDWDTTKNPIQGNITGVVRGEKINHVTESAIWEALSFQIPLMLDANKNTEHYLYKALLKGEIDTYDFVLTSIKKIDYANKNYDALQMVRTDPIKNRALHIWLAPDLHNIPVLIENYRKGKVHSKVVLESVQFNKDKPLLKDNSDDDDEF